MGPLTTLYIMEPRRAAGYEERSGGHLLRVDPFPGVVEDGLHLRVRVISFIEDFIELVE